MSDSPSSPTWQKERVHDAPTKQLDALVSFVLRENEKVFAAREELMQKRVTIFVFYVQQV